MSLISRIAPRERMANPCPPGGEYFHRYLSYCLQLILIHQQLLIYSEQAYRISHNMILF